MSRLEGGWSQGRSIIFPSRGAVGSILGIKLAWWYVSHGVGARLRYQCGEYSGEHFPFDWAQWTLGYINLGVNNIQSTKGCVRGSGDMCTYATSKASRVLALRVFSFALKGLVAGENVDVRAYRQKPGPAGLYQNSRG